MLEALRRLGLGPAPSVGRLRMVPFAVVLMEGSEVCDGYGGDMAGGEVWEEYGGELMLATRLRRAVCVCE